MPRKSLGRERQEEGNTMLFESFDGDSEFMEDYIYLCVEASRALRDLAHVTTSVEGAKLLSGAAMFEEWAAAEQQKLLSADIATGYEGLREEWDRLEADWSATPRHERKQAAFALVLEAEGMTVNEYRLLAQGQPIRAAGNQGIRELFNALLADGDLERVPVSPGHPTQGYYWYVAQKPLVGAIAELDRQFQG